MPNVPPTNLIMEQSAHCDWDWLITRYRLPIGCRSGGTPNACPMASHAIGHAHNRSD